MGTAALAASKFKWHGTLMLIGPPSEETIDRARAMLADHLYERFGKPDLAVGLHDTNTHPAGTVAIVSRQESPLDPAVVTVPWTPISSRAPGRQAKPCRGAASVRNAARPASLFFYSLTRKRPVRPSISVREGI
ncbi:MAG: hypothetical protein ACJ8R9_20910 [Steroidobacteraceae bacterium]